MRNLLKSVYLLLATGVAVGIVCLISEAGQSSAQLQGWFNLILQWGGTIQGSNSGYSEGDTIPLRFITSLPSGSTNTVLLKYDFSTGTGPQRFFDSLGSYNASVTNVNLLAGQNLSNPSLVPIPVDPGGSQVPGVFTIYNIDTNKIKFGAYGLTNGVKVLSMTFTVASGAPANKTVFIGYGGHLASANQWGAGNGASLFPGASHKAYASLNGSADLNVSVNPNAIVADNTPPVISCPGDIRTNTSLGQCSAVVGYTVTVTDNSPGVTLSCTPPSGSSFSIGTNLVVCTAIDASSNSASCSFRVLVRDLEPPTFGVSCPGQMVVTNDPGKCVAVVSFTVTASDNCGQARVVSTPPSGFAFPVGTNTVNNVATDTAGNTSSCTFKVIVLDKEPPVISCPTNVISPTDPGQCSAVVSYTLPTATDNCGKAGTVVCIPASGTVFPIGTNFVVCTAVDSVSNTNTCTFPVIVQDAGNQSWPFALPLTLVPNGNSEQATFQQSLCSLDQSRWFKFKVRPGSRLSVTLSNLVENYDLVLFKDIEAAYEQLYGSNDLAKISAQFSADGFSPAQFSPDALSTADSGLSQTAIATNQFSSTIFSTNAFSPTSLSEPAYSSDAFSPSQLSPSQLTPSQLTPSQLTPSQLTPSQLTPSQLTQSLFTERTWSAAQLQCVLAVSALDGVTSEAVTANTWDNTGNFYIYVRGRNGVFSPGNPFTLTVTQLPGGCTGVSPIALDNSGQPLPLSSTAAPSGNYKTIILTDLNRWIGGDTATKTAVSNKLYTLAMRPEVAGALVDVGADPQVSYFNAQADVHYDCPFAKNLVAGAIKAIIDRSRNVNPLQYVVIVGGDRIIPFARYPDEAMLGPERLYVPPVKDATASEASLQLNYVLNQDFYGAQCNLSLKDFLLPLPDLAVGRLVETAAEVMGMVDAYLGTAGGVLPNAASSLVTGYDFLADDAQAVASQFVQGIGPTTNNETLISPNNLAPSLCWTADNLRQALFGRHHDLIFLAGHFSASDALAADFTTHVLSSELANSGTDFTNSIVFSAGCHSGYNIVTDDGIPFVTLEPDWVEACALKRATLIAGTGFQYGDTDFIENSERIYLSFAQQLRTDPNGVPVGKALTNAKRVFLAATPQLRGIHTKSYLEANLFGLPMLSVRMPGAPYTNLVTAPSISTLIPLLVRPDLSLGLAYADLAVNPTLTNTSVVLNSVDNGSQVTATFLAGGDGIINNPAEPILPLEVRNVSVNGTVLRGVGFLGGTYSDLTNKVPLTCAPTINLRGAHTSFISEVFFPIQPWSANYFGALCSGDGVTRLMAIPAQFISDSPTVATGTIRQYSEMDFRLFYDTNTTATTYSDPLGNTNTPAFCAPPSICEVQGTTISNGTVISLSARALGNPGAGIQAVWVTYTATNGGFYGRWQSLALTQNSQDSTLWQGALPLPNGTASSSVRFIVQAVNGVGGVTVNTKHGAYYQPDEFTSGGIPTAVTLLPGPTNGAYGAAAIFSAKLTITNSNGTVLSGQRMVFSLGGLQIWSTTDSNGVATARLPLRNVPGDYQVTATFRGAAGLAPSFAQGPFTITRQTTSLSIAPTLVYSRTNLDTKIFATLTDGAGNRLIERTVFFTVTNGNGFYSVPVRTDVNGRAPLGPVSLPDGTYPVVVYFNGTIPLQGQSITLDDGLYLPSTTSGLLVLDDIPPVIQSVSASPNVLSPPNHNMIPVTITVVATDNSGGPVTSQIVSVTSSDPTNTTGDGNTGGDWFFLPGSLTVQLRAERASASVGRTYTITVQCTDLAGNVATGQTTVFVPPNNGG